jgi:hypothetical protein
MDWQRPWSRERVVPFLIKMIFSIIYDAYIFSLMIHH